MPLQPTARPSAHQACCPRHPFVLLALYLALLTSSLPTRIFTQALPHSASPALSSPSSSSSHSSGTVLIPLQRLTHKDFTPQFPPSIQKRANSASIIAPVTAVGQVGYVGNILIGTPPQRVAVLFDTGSDLALVISDRCQGRECPDLVKFSCSNSSTCLDLDDGGTNDEQATMTTKKGLAQSSHDTVVDNFTGTKVRISKMQAASKTLISENGGADKSRAIEAARLIGPDVIRVEQSLQPIEDNTDLASNTVNTGRDNRIDSIVAKPSAPSPWDTYYNQTYVDGSWGAGTFVQDHIRIDHPAQAAALSDLSAIHGATVTFLNVVQDNLGLVRGYNGQISGLLGLTRASPTGRKTFLQELVDQGSLSQSVISMHLESEGGNFLLGGIDHSQYSGELVYSPVTDPVAWQISLQGLGTQFRTATNQPKLMPQLSIFQDATLILDSGTSSILIPNAASEAIHGELSGTWDPIHRTWFLPCDGPDLIWWISSDHGVVQPYESLVHALGDGRCQSLIFNNQNVDYWILGGTWLRGLYVVYDMEGGGRVGIASAISPSVQNGSTTVGPRARILSPRGVNAGVRLQNHGLNVVTVSGLLLFTHAIIETLL